MDITRSIEINWSLHIIIFHSYRIKTFLHHFFIEYHNLQHYHSNYFAVFTPVLSSSGTHFIFSSFFKYKTTSFDPNTYFIASSISLVSKSWSSSWKKSSSMYCFSKGFSYSLCFRYFRSYCFFSSTYWGNKGCDYTYFLDFFYIDFGSVFFRPFIVFYAFYFLSAISNLRYIRILACKKLSSGWIYSTSEIYELRTFGWNVFLLSSAFSWF